MQPVLWAEDEEGDQVLIRSALEDTPAAARVRFARDGAEAVDQATRQTPRLIVLDVNMPNVGGVEALRRIRGEPGLRDVPVVMFSTARNEDEVAACESLGIKAFVRKPTDYEEFCKTVRGIVELAA